jgi:hypothetical protein
MQYLLSEKEYGELTSRKRVHDVQNKNALANLCFAAAMHIPVTKSWAPESPPKPWGCIHVQGEDDKPQQIYCDECPARAVCPAEKEYSQ